MTVLKILVFCTLGFLAVTPILGWNHVESRQKFWQTIDQGDPVLVAYVVPWTEENKALEPEWLAAASQTKTAMMSIDCVELTRVCRENGVYSYPAIRLYQGEEKRVRYRGPRTATGILSFIERSGRGPVSIIDIPNIRSFQSVDDSVFIAYLGPDSKEQRKAFIELAKKNYHRFAFGISNNVSLSGFTDLSTPSIVYYDKEPGIPKIFTADWGRKALETFMETSAKPVIGELTRRNELKYISDSKSLLYIFVQNEIERIRYRKELRQVALKYKEFLNFVTIDAVEYTHMAPGLGLRGGTFPALSLQVPADGRVFPFDVEKEIAERTVDEFIVDIVNGKLKAFGSESGSEQANAGSPHNEL